MEREEPWHEQYNRHESDLSVEKDRADIIVSVKHEFLPDIQLVAHNVAERGMTVTQIDEPMGNILGYIARFRLISLYHVPGVNSVSIYTSEKHSAK
jgi:hypothetical protein